MNRKMRHFIGYFLISLVFLILFGLIYFVFIYNTRGLF